MSGAMTATKPTSKKELRALAKLSRAALIQRLFAQQEDIKYLEEKGRLADDLLQRRSIEAQASEHAYVCAIKAMCGRG